MKFFFLLFMSVLFISNGQAQIPLHDVTDSIAVTGKILNYGAGSDNHFISFGTYDVQGRLKRQAIQINEKGLFSIKLYQPFEGDVEVNYKDTYVNLYAKPNVPLKLEINDANNELTVTGGEFAHLNKLILQFQKASSQHQFLLTSDMGNRAQTDSAYAASVRNELQEKLEFLELFVKQHQIVDQDFIVWQRNHMQYDAAQQILFFPFAGKFNKSITSTQLLGLLSGIPVENASALRNSSYYKFMNSLAGDHQIMVNINPIYAEQKAKAGKNVISVYLDEVDKFAGPISKALIYYDMCVTRGSNASNPEEFTARIHRAIAHPLLLKLLTEKNIPGSSNFKPYLILDRLNASKVSATLKGRLIKLFESYRDTNLYIDFWGDWCGPCMSEMPSYPRLIKGLEGTPIKFLFLSAFTTDESMLATKEKYQIKGDFVNLNKDEVAIMNNVLEFHSYPSHFLINKGRVVDRLTKMSTEGAAQKALEITEILKKYN